MLAKADAERAKTAAIARWGGEGVSWEGSAESAKAIGIAVALSRLASTMASRGGKRGTRDGKGEQRHVSKKIRLEVP